MTSSRIPGIPECLSPALRSTRATPLFLAALFTLLMGIQVAVYRDSFAAMPASDDFIALNQIDRGEREGVLSFFRASDVLDYRPLQNATIWLFGRVSRSHALRSVRILHFLSSAFYALVAFLWIRTLGLNRAGAVAAGCVVFLHPALAGALAGLDNFTRLVVSAWIWLGAWIAFRRGTRPGAPLALVSLCFGIGLGYMEYAVTLIPLAGLATAWREGRRFLRPVAILFGVLIAILGAYFLIRHSVIIKHSSDATYVSLEPRTWGRNAALIAGAVLFFGNTVSVLTEESPGSLAWLGANSALVTIILGLGLWSGRRLAILPVGAAHPAGFSDSIGLPRLAVFLVAACATACFPMVLMSHVSEIYVSGVVLAAALLIGLSAHAWTAAPRPLRFLALAVAASQIVLAADAIRSKVDGINGAGERTEVMMRSLLEHVPNDAPPKRVAAVFRRPSGDEGRKYSIFAMPDDELIPQGVGRLAIRWFRPDQDIRLDPLLVADPSEVDPGSYDLVLVWDGAGRRFNPLAPSASRP